MKAQATDVVIGAAAGIVATVPMTIVMEELRRILPGERDGALPPREVTEGVYEHLRGDSDPATEEHLKEATILLHYAFGGSAGAFFPLVAPRRIAPAIGAGVLYGLAVWTGTYLGILPAMGVRHHARYDSAARTGMMIAAHLVWGATLGLVLRGRPGLRAASRNPEIAER